MSEGTYEGPVQRNEYHPLQSHRRDQRGHDHRGTRQPRRRSNGHHPLRAVLRARAARARTRARSAVGAVHGRDRLGNVLDAVQLGGDLEHAAGTPLVEVDEEERGPTTVQGRARLESLFAQGTSAGSGVGRVQLGLVRHGRAAPEQVGRGVQVMVDQVHLAVGRAREPVDGAVESCGVLDVEVGLPHVGEF